MDIREIVEATLVAPFRAVAAARQMSVAEERAALDRAINEMKVAVELGTTVHLGPKHTAVVLNHIDRLQMLANAYRQESSKHETFVREVLDLLDADDLDGARDRVKHEHGAIHGPTDSEL